MIDTVGFLNASQTNTNISDTPKKDMGKGDFMNLMIMQYQNQDPLEPMKDTEYLAQMAQFSSLEQMQNVAEGMEMLALSQTASTNSQMVNLIDKRVIVEGDIISVDGDNPVDVKFELPEDQSVAEIVIRDSEGNMVRSITPEGLTSGLNRITFDSKNSDGEVLSRGNYTYELLDNDGKKIDGAKQWSNILIDSVAYDSDKVMLKSGNFAVSVADITEVIKNQGGN